jgi:hypothetical protein
VQWSRRELVEQAVSRERCQGALPTLYAAAAPNLSGAEYVGRSEVVWRWARRPRTSPVQCARDAQTAARLWEVSKHLSGVHYVI